MFEMWHLAFFQQNGSRTDHDNRKQLQREQRCCSKTQEYPLVKPGKPSEADRLLNVVKLATVRETIEAPADLQPVARTIFRQYVRSVRADHFRKSDIHLLASLAQVTHLVRHNAREMAEGDQFSRAAAYTRFMECIKVQAQLATKLRLTPQSRANSATAERTTRVPLQPEPWVMDDEPA